MEAWARFGTGVGLRICVIAFGLLVAFPIKWCWNYTLPWMFHWPSIEWGHAWCLLFLLQQFHMTIHWCDHKVKAQ